MSAAEDTVVCTYSRRHRIYRTRHYPVLGRYASSCTDLSSLDPKYSSKKNLVSRNILSKIFLERKTRTRLYLLKLSMLHFGTRVLTSCPLPGGRLVAHGQSVYPCHEDGIQFGPYLTTALDEVGCDVSLSWVGLGWVVLWLGWVRWCGGRRCR